MPKVTLYRFKVFLVLVALTTGVGILDAYLGNEPNDPEWAASLRNGTLLWFAGGILVWGLELLYVPSAAGEWIRQQHYLVAILLKSVYLIFVVTALGYFDRVYLHDIPGFGFLTRPEFFRSLIFVFAVILLMQVVIQIISFVGGRTLVSFLLGRYYHPIREDTIFMFLDLAGSTALSEKMGDIGVHGMISKFFFDIDEPIIANGGNIHRYVGDQVVVTWPVRQHAPNMRSVRCCFAIRERVERKADEYREAFGVVPAFRIGLHSGSVVISQCGDRKKEISYFGDTVNSAARIEQACKTTGDWLLMSSELVQHVDFAEGYRCVERGELQLRGRSKPTKLFTVEMEGGATA